MTFQADKKRTEREFVVGDWVYLRLQPYRQQSFVARRNFKLSPRFFGPFQIVQRVGQVAYKLELLPISCIHPVFHISCLKKKLGQHHSPLSSLPPVDLQGELTHEPEAILQRRMRQVHDRTVVDVLVQWKGASVDDATWEPYWSLRDRFPHLVGKGTVNQNTDDIKSDGYDHACSL
ncbi:hypothetical protein F2P56_022675 [Juglans regia]|uniref:Uncharacterized protein LOC108982221 n=2 Tax=Juglans regia TaxID=51240 RepID=A0A2I4DPJ9_JUGRE|nr:uncharacterized protein LOC108982221 [Juglans regia]KAF5458662.1 hypothetical protein F2P56_022675 [Juglans regia]